MKHFTTKITFGVMLSAASLFIACSDSKVSGTDEQANSVNADAVIKTWLESDTLKEETTCSDPNCSSDPIIVDPSLPSGIRTEKGELVRIYKRDLESIYCETKENWFVYSVKVSAISVDKNFTIPDSISAELFKQDCDSEHGLLKENEIGTPGQKFYTCQLVSMLDTVAAPGSMQYFDANWNKYAQQIVDICGEPIEVDPLDIESPQVEIREDDDVKYMSETDETLSSYLYGNPLSEGIQVDNWCVEKGLSYECGNNGVHLDYGIVYHMYLGTSESIRCQGYISDSLGEVEKIHSYTVFLDSNTVTKTWREDDFKRMKAEERSLAKTNFTEYCDNEKGTIVNDTDSEISCQIKIAPVNKEDVEVNGAEPFYNYNDPVWDIYGTKVIAACR